ncbi:MAG: hypothetical protein ABIR78_05875 [Ferruginibacter sp.]
MKQFFILLLAVAGCNFLQAQSVVINTASPNSSAQLDVVSTTKGLLIPRMIASQRTD